LKLALCPNSGGLRLLCSHRPRTLHELEWRGSGAPVLDRVARGHTSIREPMAHYRMHIRPQLGAKHIREWTGDDMRELSAVLDRKVQASEVA